MKVLKTFGSVDIIESNNSTLGGNPAYMVVEGYEPIPEGCG
jgi:hypothetical protein